MALKDIASGRSDLYQLDPNLLKVKSDWNSRDFENPDNVAHVEQLALSIAEIGVKEPIKVVWEDNTPYITNGECRYRAVMLCLQRGIEIKSVPVLAEGRYGNEADRIFTQIASNSGKPFTQLEQAKVFKKLLDLGWIAKDIAAKAGITGSRVSQILELLTLPEPVKAMVAAGEVSAGMALATVKSDADAVSTLQDAVTNAKASGRVRALPKDAGERKPSASKVIKDIIETAFEEKRFDESEDMVTVSFRENEWAIILNVLKI